MEHYSTHSGSLLVYTDGSESDAGYSVILPSFCRGGRLPRVASFLRAELSAIILALEIFYLTGFTIFSDFRNALSVLEHHEREWG